MRGIAKVQKQAQKAATLIAVLLSWEMCYIVCTLITCQGGPDQFCMLTEKELQLISAG